MFNPKVTVCIPNYNGAPFLKECLDSALNQTYENLEIIIVDDGSDDESVEIFEEYVRMDDRIKFFPKPHRGGGGWGQSNVAMEHVTGEFVSWLCSDDKYELTFWERTLPYFTDSKIGIVRVGTLFFGTRYMEPVYQRPLKWNSPWELLEENKVFTSSPWRYEMYKSAGPFDDTTDWTDWDFWINAILVKGWKWATCNEPLFFYRIHDKQITQTRRYKFKEFHTYLAKKYYHFKSFAGITKGPIHTAWMKGEEDENKK